MSRAQKITVAGLAAALLGAAITTAADEPPSPVRMDSLVHGLATCMSSSAEQLQRRGERLQATRALDRARQLARVLDEIADTSMAATAHETLRAVRSARHALQVGRPREASQWLIRGADALGRFTDAHPVLAVPRRNRLEDSVGKIVINAEGQRIGELDRTTELDDGPYAVVRSGGAIDWFGFLDFGNRWLAIPADRLVAGRHEVVLTTTATASELRASADR